MGRNAKTEYPRTEVIKVRSSAEHIALLGNIQGALVNFQASEADIISWALEEFASRNFKSKIKFIPRTHPKWKTKQRGKTIVMGASNG
jgi:hypothetical protein